MRKPAALLGLITIANLLTIVQSYNCTIVQIYGSAFAQKYWQQEVHYRIEVRLDDVNHELFAKETIRYINNSPDTLNLIYLHLWPNAYKNNTTALAKQKLENGSTLLYYAHDSERGYIHKLDFKVNDQPVRWEYDSLNIDICNLKLNEPLLPGGELTIATPFHVKIPKGVFSRLGHIGQSYQISQWYPKPAVYDQRGWHPIPYLDQGEFYSEYGSFDVSITLPKNYVLAATGDLVDGENELQFLEEKVKQTQSLIADNGFNAPKSKKRNIRVKVGGGGSEDDENEEEGGTFLPSDSVIKTLRFHQENVHDFAWFADKRWHVLKGEIRLPNSGRMVDTWAMFTDAEPELWENAVEYINDAVFWYSYWNGDYPYNHATAVDGSISAGGGMEYPNITVIGTMGDEFLLELVIAHEVGHNWFYGILGSDERTHPWMDEGINSFYELRYVEAKYPKKRLLSDNKAVRLLDLGDNAYKTQYYFQYLLNARRNLEQPIGGVPSEKYTKFNYGTIVYSKSAIAFDYLRSYLGDTIFDKAMNAYYEQWKFRHPMPEDLRKIMEDVSGQNLGWFFDDMLNTTHKLDYKILDARTVNDTLFLTIRNRGDIAGPLFISGMNGDSAVATLWYEGFKGKKSLPFLKGNFNAWRIDAGLNMPEINRKNNTLKASGIFKKTEPLKLQLLGSLENPVKTQVFWMPAIVGWNNYDRLMLGAAFYSMPIPAKTVEYALMPLYSFGAGGLAGSSEMSWNIYPESRWFEHVRLGVSASRYSYDVTGEKKLRFYKLTPAFGVKFRNQDPRSPIAHELKLRQVYINEEIAVTGENGSDNIFTDPFYINEIQYKFSNNQTNDPQWFTLTLHQNEEFLKVAFTMYQRLSYRRSSHGATLRFFTGRIIPFDESFIDPRFGFSMNGKNGYQDYTYDEVFLGRSETGGLLARQFLSADGGFRHPAETGVAQSWLTALNLRVPFPKILPVALYVGTGWSSYNPSKIVWETSAAMIILPEIFEVYFPIFSSADPINLNYRERIRFTLNLTRLNPLELLRDFDL